MIRRVVSMRGTYRDSITLLKISQGVESVPGVHQAAVVMATPLNKRVLSEIGFAGPEVVGAKTDDLIIAVEAESEGSLKDAMVETNRLLTTSESESAAKSASSSLQEALTKLPDSNFAVISVPGAYAKHETMVALEAGLNAFVFSSNVSREDERELKEVAAKKNLLVMGPDCGTAIINHVVLGFGNDVRPGPIGLVSASGTGLQEVSCIIHRNGLGISQAIGTGGGDMSDAVGGLTTRQALELLDADEETKTIVVISKPPGPKTMKAVLAAVRKSGKPVVMNFLGAEETPLSLGKHRWARTLGEAANVACALAGKQAASIGPTDQSKLAFKEASMLSKTQRYVRGLYAGGTLCYEAQVVLIPLLGPVSSNAPLHKTYRTDGAAKSRGHTCIDLGAEEFVVGRAHPMMDFTIRKMRVYQEAKDPQTAVLLLDVELGLGSNADPAGELVPAISEAKALAAKTGRYLSVVASVVGTEGDFQNLRAQTQKLLDAGVVVATCNSEAAELAALIATRGKTYGSTGA
jgi:FdrA protein